YDPSVGALVWSSFAFLLVAAGGGATFAGLRGLRAWRTFRSLRRSIGAGLVEVTARVAGMEARLAQATASAARLERAQRQLQDSLATARLLAAAAGDARGALRVLSLLRR